MQALASLPTLRSLPVHLHREILKSDSLALYSQFGTLLTDQFREDALERHLQRCVCSVKDDNKYEMYLNWSDLRTLV